MTVKRGAIPAGGKGTRLGELTKVTDNHPDNAWVALKWVHDPKRYGVAGLTGNEVISI